jgi:RimJ/RimL family protein N-acetyltransferase
VRLIPLSTASLLEQCAGWLADPANHQWLDFARQAVGLTPALLKLTSQKPDHAIRAFTDDRGAQAIGVVGLDHVDPDAGTAAVWVVLGNKAFARKGYATGAMSKMLTIGFTELCLGAISAMIVEHHYAVGLVERLDFRYVGRQRQCHQIGGRRYDRLLFDLLAVEHKELRHVPRAGHAGTSAADLLVHES